MITALPPWQGGGDMGDIGFMESVKDQLGSAVAWIGRDTIVLALRQRPACQAQVAQLVREFRKE